MFGILGWTLLPCIGGIVAIVTGHMARSRIRRMSGLGGNGMAIAGLVLGYLYMSLIVLGVVAGLVVFAVGGINNNSQSSACKIDLRTLQTAVQAYKAQFGEYPTSQTEVIDSNMLEVPSTNYDFTSDGTTVTFRSISPECPTP